MNIKLTQTQIDALREIGTIGMGNATTGISKMIKRRVDITVPSASLVTLEDVPHVFGGPENIVSTIFFQLMGDISGSMLLVFERTQALKLVDLILDKEVGHTKFLDDFGQSALKEMGNIAAGSYATALSGVIGSPITYSIPHFVTDMLGAILDGILINLALELEHAVVIESEFTIGDHVVKGHFLFIPDQEGLEKLLNHLGVS